MNQKSVASLSNRDIMVTDNGGVFVSAIEKLGQIGAHMEKMDRDMPGPSRKFMEFNNSVFQQGELSTKAKELMAVAVSISTQCEWCISYHTRMALENGATE